MGTYSGAEQPMCDAWVKARIATVASQLDTISTGLSTRVYLDYAPKDAKYPFIIFQCQDPPRDVRGVGVSRVMVDTLYVVKAVAQVDSYAPLAPIASLIDQAMTSAQGGSVGDGHVFAAVRDTAFSLVEVEAGTQYRHLGGQYKMQAQG